MVSPVMSVMLALVHSHVVSSDDMHYLANCSDIIFVSRTRGHLFHQATHFQFIGPDWEPVAFTDNDQYLHAAQVITDTGISNYKKSYQKSLMPLFHERTKPRSCL